MRFLIVVSMFFFGALAYANPGVTKNTDVDKRKVVRHNQVTRCTPGEAHCTTDSVTEFSRSMIKINYYGECNYVDDGTKTYEHCKITHKKPKPKVKTVVKVKTKTVEVIKKNRVQLHLGHGTKGLEQSSTNNSTTVKEDVGIVGGVGYQRHLEDGYSFGATAFTNKSIFVTVGFDY